VAVIPTAEAAGPDLLPLTVTNESGRTDPVHLYVLGVSDGRLGYVTEAGGFTPWTGGAHPPVPAPDVSVAGPAAGASKTIPIPKGLSGRMYMSFADKLDFRLTPDVLVQPAPWAAGDGNADILFDWSEFTYNDAGVFLISSQVDMFAVPHAVSVTGSDGQTRETGRLNRAAGRRSSTASGPTRCSVGWCRPATTVRCSACSPRARVRTGATSRPTSWTGSSPPPGPRTPPPTWWSGRSWTGPTRCSAGVPPVT
jgi:hypothetical protein